MPYFTYDTSVIISRKIPDLREMPQDFVLSSVVLLELTSSAADPSERKVYEQLFHQYRRDKLLLIPNDEDWLLASKILYLITNARRHKRTGKLPRLPRGASQHLALDVLIAVSARRWNTRVVTENWSDFKAIQRYCNATVVRASKFFRD